MDPDAALDELFAAIVGHDWNQVNELSEALLTWLQKGGFPPQTLGPKELGRGWHRAMAEFTCYLAKSRVRDSRRRRKKRAV